MGRPTIKSIIKYSLLSLGVFVLIFAYSNCSEQSKFHFKGFKYNSSGIDPISGFWDPGFSNGTWRTDFDNPNLGLSSAPLTLTNCAFNLSTDPFLLNGAGSTYWSAATGSQVVCDQASQTYLESNSTTSALTWPTNNFWVVTANSERAFGPEGSCSDGGPNTGPPNQSKKIFNPGQGMYGVDVSNGKAVLSIDTLNFPNCVSPVDKGKINFVSLGAQSGRGNGNLPITYINAPGYPQLLKFKFNIESIAPDGTTSSTGRPRHNYAYVLIEAQWGGVRRWVFINLLHRTPEIPDINRIHWNWNIRESMWYPGAEFVNISASQLANTCPGANILAPLLAPQNGASGNFEINLNDLYTCLNNLPLQKNWSQYMPLNMPVPITGIHWATEQTLGSNQITVSIQNPSLEQTSWTGIKACPAYWEILGSFSCSNGQEHQRVCNCQPPLYNDPLYWVTEPNNCYSHITGRSCEQARCNLAVTYNGGLGTETSVPLNKYYGYSWNFVDYSGNTVKPPTGASAHWMGTKNGVADVVAGQEPQSLTRTSTGNIFQNTLSPNISGNYTRYLVIKDANNNTWCQTNAVTINLLP